jgi:hypothetical protein
MRFSISDLLPYLDCRYKGAVRYMNKLWTAPTVRQQLGTIVHQHCDTLLKTGRINHDHSWIDPTLFHEAEPLLSEADLALCPPPFEVLGSEVPLSLRFGSINATTSLNHQLVGRLDAVAKKDDRIYSVQWKTIGKGISIGPFLEKVRMSPHEISYRHMLRQDDRYKECAGTLLGVFRTYLTKQQKEDNVPRFEIFELNASPQEDQAAFEQDILPSLRAIIQDCISPQAPPRNWTACHSIFGTCPLYHHCHSGAAVRDCVAHSVEDRYSDVPQ